MPSETCVAKLGGSSCNNVVPLGGHHGQVQALLDGPAASGVAVQAVGDGGNDLVGAFRGSGKKASGYDTVSVVSGWSSLTPSLLWLGRVLLLGLVPRLSLTGWYPVLRSPPCAGFVVLTRWSGAFFLLPWLGLGPVAGCLSLVWWPVLISGIAVEPRQSLLPPE